MAVEAQTIRADRWTPVVSATSSRIRDAFTPALDVAALRRIDLRRPPSRLPGVRVRPVRVDARRGPSVLAAELVPVRGVRDGRTLVYVHGGAYVAGPNSLEVLVAAMLCRALGVRTLMPFYRRAPEHPFPAAFDDVSAVLDSLATREAGRIVMAGDSAGGGLAAALALHRDDIERLGLISPWLDVSLQEPDITDSRDVILAVPGLQEAGRAYAGGADRDDPRLSPANGDLSRLPPTMVIAGTDEVFMPDARRFVDRASAAGASMRLVTGQDLFHGWAIVPLIPSGRAARRLLVEHLSRDQSPD